MDGLIHVHAKVPNTGKESTIQIDRNSGRSKAQLDSLRDIHIALGLGDE